jgi:serine/threonine-protein kinase
LEPQVQSIGRYRIVETIGRGAIGVVYRALDPRGEHVAVKVLAADVCDDPELVERFRREALSAAELDHPNITRVHDFGEEGRRLFMAMELLDGDDLKSVIEQGGPAGLAARLSIMVQVAAGMAFVHARGLVHRDLKPGNIHIKPDGCAKIMDFGLVRPSESEMTRTGTVLGSPSYMSPEQMRGERVDARSDVFSLGSVFYELLTGRRAFAGRGITQIMMAVLASEPEPMERVAPAVPAPVARIVARCLGKSPEDRYRNAGELHAALEVVQPIYGAA